MSTFNFIQPVEFLMRYEADTIEEARSKALEFSATHTVGDFWDAAQNLWILDPREDTDDCEPEGVDRGPSNAISREELHSALHELVKVSLGVVATWEGGDLALAVNALEQVALDAQFILNKKAHT